MVVLGIFAFILPLIIFSVVLIAHQSPDDKGSAWAVLGFVGCLIMGIGLFNLVAIIIKQYLGHLLTILSLLIGGALVGISCVIMYVPRIYQLFNEEITTFFFVTNLFYLFIAMFYLLFRGGVKNHLKRKGIGKGGKMKGARSFWFYSELHKSKKIGFVYVINLIFLISYMLLGALILCGGYFRVMQIPISVAFSFCSLLLLIMNLFTMVEGNLDEYQTPIIFLRRTSNNGIDFIGFQVIIALIPCIVAYAHWRLIF